MVPGYLPRMSQWRSPPGWWEAFPQATERGTEPLSSRTRGQRRSAPQGLSCRPTLRPLASHVDGRSVNAPLLTALTTPLPDIRSPFHVASALRVVAIHILLGLPLGVNIYGRSHKRQRPPLKTVLNPTIKLIGEANKWRHARRPLSTWLFLILR